MGWNYNPEEHNKEVGFIFVNRKACKVHILKGVNCPDCGSYVPRDNGTFKRKDWTYTGRCTKCGEKIEITAV